MFKLHRIDTKVPDICIHLSSYKIIEYFIINKCLEYKTILYSYTLNIADIKRAIIILSQNDGEVAKYNLDILIKVSNTLGSGIHHLFFKIDKY
jgi:hypothetical protein